MIQDKNPPSDMETLIFETALKLFTEKGYFNTSVHDIQKEAKVSIGSIYHYFKNKEAIAKAIYRDLVRHMEEAVLEIRDNYQTCHDRGRAVVDYLFDMTEKNPGKMQYLLYALHKEFMPGEKSICSSVPFEIIRNMVQEGIDNGEIREIDPAVASACLLGGALRMIRLELDSFLEKPVSNYLDETWECSWRAVCS